MAANNISLVRDDRAVDETAVGKGYLLLELYQSTTELYNFLPFNAMIFTQTDLKDWATMLQCPC